MSERVIGQGTTVDPWVPDVFTKIWDAANTVTAEGNVTLEIY